MGASTKQLGIAIHGGRADRGAFMKPLIDSVEVLSRSPSLFLFLPF